MNRYLLLVVNTNLKRNSWAGYESIFDLLNKLQLQEFRVNKVMLQFIYQNRIVYCWLKLVRSLLFCLYEKFLFLWSKVIEPICP